ncbi:hypothetical protein OC834_005796 [Tilletia horrida]|nr:hypothetical protein OC834_005796 [Tilletia horrida]
MTIGHAGTEERDVSIGTTKRPDRAPDHIVDALQLAVEQNRQQWLDVAAQLHHTIDAATKAIDTRMNAVVQRIRDESRAATAEKAVATSQESSTRRTTDGVYPLKTMDINLSPDSQRSRSINAEVASGAKKDDPNHAELAARLAKAEQERDSIKEKYKREHKKHKAFKAWWEANVVAAAATPGINAGPATTGADPAPTLQQAHTRREAETTQAGSPAKRRRIEAPGGPSIGATNDAIPGDALVAMSPHRSASTSPTKPATPLMRQQDPPAGSPSKPSGSGLPSSLANMHFSRDDKNMLRSLGLALPKSPIKRGSEMAPDRQPASETTHVNSTYAPQPTLQQQSRGRSTQREDAPSASRPPALDPPPMQRDATPASSPPASPSGDRVETQLDAELGWNTPSNAKASHALHTLVRAVRSRSASPAKDSSRSPRAGGGALPMPMTAASTSASVHTPFADPSREAGGPNAAPPSISPSMPVRSGLGLVSTSATASRAGHEARSAALVRYELDPAMNGGRAYEYEEVVRGREARRHLIAGDCLECKEWYERVGPTPSPPGPVYEPYTAFGKELKAAREERRAREAATGSASASVPSHAAPLRHSRCKHHGAAAVAAAAAAAASGAAGDLRQGGAGPEAEDGNGDDGVSACRPRRGSITVQLTDADRRQAHRQAISRHRNTAPVSLTPPGFWEIGFPSTQHVEELNEETEAMREARLARMAADPRYRPRQSR